MTINELQNNVIEEFADFDDWMDKYALLIDLGNSLPPLEEKYKTESNLIEGCQSRVWLQADYVRWQDPVQRRERCGNRQRDRLFADQHPVRPHPAGNTGCRSLLH